MSSSISAARQALYTLLDAQTGTGGTLEGVQVAFGAPGGYEQQEVVALLGVDNVEESPETVGNRRNAERFQLTVGVKSYDPAASTAQDVDQRGFALADAVREVVFGNVTLSATVKWAYPSSQQSEGALPAKDGGWVIFLRVLIACQSFIT